MKDMSVAELQKAYNDMQLREKSLLDKWGAENLRLGMEIDRLKEEVERLKCCGNCRYYNSHECYLFHNWSPYKKCERKRKWKFAPRPAEKETA